MKFKKYIATFYARNEKTGKLQNVGSQEVWQFENDEMSLIAKAFTHAQGEQRNAVTVEFQEL